jgi:hypothetical protein
MSAKIININSEQEEKRGRDKGRGRAIERKKRGMKSPRCHTASIPSTRVHMGGIKTWNWGCTYERPVGFGEEIFFLFEYLVGHEETDLDRSRRRSRSVIGVGGRK